MNSIIVAWNKGSDTQFEHHVPLLFSARRNDHLGFRKSFHLVFLYGLERLSAEYRSALERSGYILHDATDVYQPLRAKYSGLERFGDYERNCFLRWLVIQEMFGNRPFVHYDGDVLFNAPPDELEKDFEGLTFILQGCPAFSHIVDDEWLPGYRAELDRFCADMEAYSRVAWAMREEKMADPGLNKGLLWDRKILSSDQDFLQYLTISGRLPQAGQDVIDGRTQMALFQNPMRIGRDIALPMPLTYERRQGVDYVGGRKVALWHMQSGFCNYVGYASMLRSLGAVGRYGDVADQRPMPYKIYRIIRKFASTYERLPLFERYLGQREDLSFLFNERRYWQPGVFQ